MANTVKLDYTADEINERLGKVADVIQTTGESAEAVMSQKAVNDIFKKLAVGSINVAPPTLTAGYVKSTGELATHTSYYRTDYIPLDTSKTYVHFTMKNAIDNRFTGPRRIAFYNRNKEYINGSYVDNADSIKSFVIPEGACYIVGDIYTTTGTDQIPFAYCNDSDTIDTTLYAEYAPFERIKYEAMPAEILEMGEDFDELKEDVNGLTITNASVNIAPPVWNSGTLNSLGVVVSNSAYYHTDYIKLDTSKAYVHIASAHTTASGFTYGNTIVFYDATKSLVQHIGNGTDKAKTFAIPEGAVYLRFSLWGGAEITTIPFVYCDNNDTIDTGLYTEYYNERMFNPNNVPAMTSWYGKNVLVIGDSLTAAGVWQRKLKDILGMNVATHAKGGQGIIQCVDGENGAGEFDNETATTGTLYALNTTDVIDKDLIIFFAGYNNRGTADGSVGDCYATDGTGQNTIAGMTQYAINRIYEELTEADNLTCRVAVITPHCAGKYGYINADGYDEYPAGSGRSLKTLADTIQSVAEHNNVPCYNAWRESGINKFTWSVYSASKTPTNTDGSGSGSYPHNNDQLHLNASVGYPYLGTRIANWIKTI